MAIKGLLHTVQEGHSVKEAVLTFTVTPQIQDPHSYQKLLETGQPLSGCYQKFEPVNTVEVKMDINPLSTQQKTITNSGFKLIAFKNGKATNIIQGLNQPNSGVFTFNTIDYTRWINFFPFALDSAIHIAGFNPNYKVQSFGLLFIDEFFFENAKDYNPGDLFNTSSTNLPQGIVDSAFMDYNLVMRRNKEGKIYQENLSINIFDDLQKKTIRITNYIIFQIQPVSFVELLMNTEFHSYLDFIHKENKSTLIDILNPDISNLIGLHL